MPVSHLSLAAQTVLAAALRCRDLLTAYLIAEACERYPDKIKFHFDMQLQTLDLEGKHASFQSMSDGSATTVSYDFLIGADGANSRYNDRLHFSKYGVSDCVGDPLLSWTGR